MQYSNSIIQSGHNLFSTNQSKRFVLGSPKSQGIDYRYNTRDWLIHINHHNLSQSAPSQDNDDRFGMQIGYDVKALIGSQQNMPQNWNGNISWFAYRISGVPVPGTNSQRVGYAFWYDKSNRLEKANFGFFTTSWQTTDRYNVRDILYHQNGNITALKRYNQSGNLLHNYTYSYYENTNRLRRVTGSGNNYDYDHNGNMIQDLANGIDFVIYDIHNLPVRVFTMQGAPWDYAYDHNGNRVRKYTGVETNYYINGIDGRTEVVTDKISSWGTYNLYGLDIIGQIRRSGSTWNRYYFLKDHLGSIRVIIVDASGNVVAYDDYYPFGMVMPGRTQDTTSVDGSYYYYQNVTPTGFYRG